MRSMRSGTAWGGVCSFRKVHLNECGYIHTRLWLYNNIFWHINEYSRGFCGFSYGIFLSEGNLTVTCRHLESLSWTVDLMVTLW